jgi:para-aminobenzoate synthetase component I
MFQDSVAYFNANNANKANYLCFGEGEKFVSKEKTDFSALQKFLDQNNGRFIYSFLGYDLKNDIENLRSNNDDFLDFPTAFFHVPTFVVEIKVGDFTFIQGEESVEAKQFVADFFQQLKQENHQTIHFQPRISKEQYLEHVNALKAHIQRGDIYEINFCQEYAAEQVKLENPLAVYARLNEVTNAPFSVYLQEKNLFVMSGSPERFIQKKGNRLLSQPIKGTAPRGKSMEEDAMVKDALRNNPKEIAENVMIVDLVRNDLAKIAQKGSVEVEELFGIYTFNTVHQMISTIACDLKETITFVDIIRATFPMGSMTGAPKVSAMQLSERYESFKRGLYAGSIGYILPNGDFDFNVLIRSFLYNQTNRYLSCSVGGAITIKSDAEAEYSECETKIGRLMAAFQNGN